MRMVARRNRLNDYKWLFYHKDHLLLHKKLTEHVILGAERWSGYDYGEGYFYQSCKQIGITGFRDTEARIKQIDLLHHTAGKTVLEIGCNSGFIAIAAMTGLSCITHTTPPPPYIPNLPIYYTAFDIAPYLIDIAKETATFLKLQNLDFQCTSFEKFNSDRKFDVILSFANHSTFDGKTEQTVEQYFMRCARFCADDGIMIFESHHPHYEKNLGEVMQVIDKYFIEQSREKVKIGNYYDVGRTVAVYKKK
jgi:SAM-dependent methyltransferase